MATLSTPAQQRAVEMNVLVRKQRSLWQDAMYRLVRNKAAMAGIVVIVLAGLVAIFAPVLAPYDPIQQHVGRNTFDPLWGDPKYVDPAYVLGTDQLGRDILSRLMYSARVSMIISSTVTESVFS